MHLVRFVIRIYHDARSPERQTINLPPFFLNTQSRRSMEAWVISDFRREVDENCAILRYYAASSGNSLPTFRDNLSVPFPPPSSTLSSGTTLLRTYHRPHSSLYNPPTRVTGFLLGYLISEEGTDRLSRNVGKELLLLAAQ